MARSSTKRLIFHLALTLFMMAFIFWQSALPAEVSSQESGAIVRFLAGLLHADEDLISFIVRKTAHFTEYLVLGLCLFLTVRDFRWQKNCKAYNSAKRFSGMPADRKPGSAVPPADRKPGSAVPPAGSGISACLVPWAIGTLYAVSDEVHQYFVPGRSCELRDMLIDACGVAVGAAALWRLSRRQRNERPDP